MNILFLGPQGSGKGTQAHMLREKMQLHYFDMGAFLREMAESHEELKQHLSNGELLPDELVNSLVKDYLAKNNAYDNMVYDGYPRRVGQLQFLQDLLKEHGTNLDFTVYLSIPEDETIRRLSARRVHKTTGEIYNMITNPPPAAVSPEDLEHRTDDQPEAIQKRLQQYHADTEPLLAQLRTATKFIEVDGTQSIEKIHADIWNQLHTQD